MPPAAPSLLSVLITGGAGSVGRAVLQALRDRYRGDLVVSILDLNPIRFDLFPNALYCDFEFYRCDVKNATEVRQVLRNVRPEVVIHCARTGYLKGDTSAAPQPILLQTNVEGTRNVMAAAKEAGVKGFVYLSTADVVVGDSWADYLDVTEDCPIPKHFDNPYNESIALAEKIVLSDASSPLRVIVVRASTTIDSSHSGVVARIHRKHSSLFTRWVPSNNEAMLDVISVQNLGLGLIMAAESLMRTAGEANGKTFIISDTRIPVRDLEREVLGGSGDDFEHCVLPPGLSHLVLWIERILAWLRPEIRYENIVRTRTYNCSLGKGTLGYKRAVCLSEGIQKARTVSLAELFLASDRRVLRSL